MPEIVTVLPVLAFLSAKAPEALPASTERVSPMILPVKVAPVVVRVAAVVPSYSFVVVVMPVTVRALAVMVPELVDDPETE